MKKIKQIPKMLIKPKAKKKAQWGAELGTNQFINGPGDPVLGGVAPANPYLWGNVQPLPNSNAGDPILMPAPTSLNWNNPAPINANSKTRVAPAITKTNIISPSIAENIQSIPQNTNPKINFGKFNLQPDCDCSAPNAPSHCNCEGETNSFQRISPVQTDKISAESQMSPKADISKVNTSGAGRTAPEAKKPLSMPEGAGAGGGGFTGQGILMGLSMMDALMGPDRKKRKYLRPEDLPTNQNFSYGTGSQALSKNGATIKGNKKAFWGALIGAAQGAGLNPVKGLHNNLNEAAAPLLNIANTATAEGERLDNMEYQDLSHLQIPQQLPLQYQQPQYMNMGGAVPGLTGQYYGRVPEMKDGGWIPKHLKKGRCTPAPNPDCPVGSPQYNLAMTFKKHHGFHKKEDGGTIQYADGGTLMTGEGGTTSLKSYNPWDGGTMQFNGNSHAQGGVDIQYNSQPVEVEGGETAFQDRNGDLKIMGNLKVPGTNMKYKALSKRLADKEKQVQKYVDKGTLLLNTASPEDPYERLSFNAGIAMTKGGMMKQKQLAAMKEHLGEMQEFHLQAINEHGVPKAKNGRTMYRDGGTTPNPPKKWTFKGTNIKKLDPKIKTFVDMLAEKGIEGYSGAQGGYRNSKTKSGRTSRHSKNQALDIIPVAGEAAYQQILKDLELVVYMMNNGLTVINEYNPDVSKQTGATAGHLHIGYDKGTKVADTFRQEVASLYPQYGQVETQYRLHDGQTYSAQQLKDLYEWTDADIASGVASGIAKPIITSRFKNKYSPTPITNNSGDAYTENYPGNENPGVYNAPPVDFKANTAPPAQIQGNDTPFNINDSTASQKPYKASRRLPLNQILGEAYAFATNREEPVKAQLYQPDLYSPYQVSFQDRINENNATFKGIEKQLAYDPTALSSLAAQQYGANSSVLGEEFRTNQAINNDIINKNVSLLNEAKKTNLGILDQQYVRQATAHSKTQSVNQDILNSISSKFLQKEANANLMETYKNLYPDYGFDKNNKVGKITPNDYQFDYGMTGENSGSPKDVKTTIATKQGNQTTTQYFDTSTREALDRLQLEAAQMKKMEKIVPWSKRLTNSNLSKKFATFQ